VIIDVGYAIMGGRKVLSKELTDLYLHFTAVRVELGGL
jgi:hypothetical protein